MAISGTAPDIIGGVAWLDAGMNNGHLNVYGRF